MQFLEEYIAIELESNWSVTRGTASLLDNAAYRLRKRGFHRTANLCSCVADKLVEKSMKRK